jgi:hypothetical protein
VNPCGLLLIKDVLRMQFIRHFSQILMSKSVIFITIVKKRPKHFCAKKWNLVEKNMFCGRE